MNLILPSDAVAACIRVHEGQTRKDGKTPYAVHPLRVALAISSFGNRTGVLAAALLHDVLEDQPERITYEVIERDFGKEVAGTVLDEAPFEAFGQVIGMDGRVGHPIAREWRFFAKSTGEVVCWHPYWTPGAFGPEQHPWGVRLNAKQQMEAIPGPPGWEAALDDLETPLSTADFTVLQNYARTAAEACSDGDAWSIDFAKDRNGKWYLIDMAIAAQSHHRPGCEKNEFNRERAT